ncbi:MAG: hypothetical protein AB7R55_03970 [Gemmatimonadales bacterium]
MRGTIGLMVAGLLMTAVTAAEGQGARPQTREGFWFSAGLGYGSLGCEDCDREGGLSGYLRLGGTLSPKVLLGVETNGWTKSEGGATLTYGNLSGVVYFYPSPDGGFHLKGGLGIARLDLDLGSFGSGGETGGGALLGLGYDARIGRNVSITPYLNFLGGSFDGGNASLAQFGVGITAH